MPAGDVNIDMRTGFEIRERPGIGRHQFEGGDAVRNPVPGRNANLEKVSHCDAARPAVRRWLRDVGAWLAEK